MQEWSESHSVMSNSLGSHELWPAKLLCHWNSPGKNTGVGGSSPPRVKPRSPTLQADSLPSETPGKPWVQTLDWEDPLEKGTATHSIILAWRWQRDERITRKSKQANDKVFVLTKFWLLLSKLMGWEFLKSIRITWNFLFGSVYSKALFQT